MNTQLKAVLSRMMGLFRATPCLAAALCIMSSAAMAATIKPADLQCEYLKAPLGLDMTQPRLSWKLAVTEDKGRGQRQSAYQILVASSEKLLQKSQGDLWDSAEVKSDQSVHVAYDGKPLASGQTCFWKVRVWDQNGSPSPWSQPSRWSMGLLHPEDWVAKWIGTDRVFTRKPGWPPPDNDMPDPWFRKGFELKESPVSAFVYVASVGYHELYVNGKKSGDAVLAPAATDHRHRARYVTYDISSQLRKGTNVLALWLGASWSIFPPYKTDDKPQSPIVLAQAEIELHDGAKIQIATDESWKTHPSPNTTLGVWDFTHFGGELYDASKEVPDWNQIQFNDSKWKKAAVFKPGLLLSSQKVEPNRLVKLIQPVAITNAGKGAFRVDMGVNYAGWLEVDLKGTPGDRIDFLLSERAETNNTHRLHSAYIIGPSGKGTFKNHFNYGSGRWVEIRGLKAEPKLSDIRGWLVRTDYERAGQFQCDLPLLNRIYDTTLWTLENITLGGYIVDCPQRERMGYGGDAHATLPTALNNYSMGALYTKWIEDWRDVQGNSKRWHPGGNAASATKTVEDGNLPYTAPTYWGGGGPGWSGICVVIPWEVYVRYGDKRILEENFPMIQSWLAFLETKVENNLLKRWGGEWDFLGDWLWPGAVGVNGDTAETLFFNNCYRIYNLQTAARIATVLGKTDAAQLYRERADAARAAVHARFFNKDDGSYVNGFPAYLAVALLVELPPAELRETVWKRLEKEILVVRKGHIHAGITGGAFLFKTLMPQRSDLIFEMASKEDYPGWGDMLRKGATTIWEDWEARESLLHSSYLYVGAWPIEGLAGIKPDPESPGFKRFIIEPAILGGDKLGWVRGKYESVYGTIESSWKIEGAKLAVAVTVPPNTTAKLILPTKDLNGIQEGGVPFNAARGILSVSVIGSKSVISLAPGKYAFTLAK